MSLADTLKAATADAHRSAESRDMQRQLVKGTLDEASLVAYLAQLRIVHADLERRLDEHAEVATAIGWPGAYRHSARLQSDVTALGGDQSLAGAATTRLLAAIDAAASATPAALLGFFYVLEGSMNGNRFIVRALRHTPAAARCSFAYFDPYGDEQPARWAAFRAALDETDLDTEQQQAVIDAALCQFSAIAEISDEVMASAPTLPG